MYDAKRSIKDFLRISRNVRCVIALIGVKHTPYFDGKLLDHFLIWMSVSHINGQIVCVFFPLFNLGFNIFIHKLVLS